MRSLANIFWLGTKELRSLSRDVMLVAFVIWAFGPSIYVQSRGGGETINNAAVAFVDEDRSNLSRAMRNALYPPYFKTPVLIAASDVDTAMDQSRYTFVVVIPPRFEADVREGRQPSVQINIDATAVQQAGIGTAYIQSIITTEATRFARRSDATAEEPIVLVARRAFNANGTNAWFQSIVGLLNQLSTLTIVLTGAALLREREHGTIEHLLVMPLNAFEIAMAKVWANGAVILVAFTLALLFVVEGALGVPIAGSKLLLLAGTTIYLFAAAAIGILLGTIARTMAQFALLMMMTIMPMMLLSGGMTPVESQPDWLQPITWLLPSRHYMSFAQAIVFRGAGFNIVWPEFLATFVLGAAFFATSLVLFRRSITQSK